MSTIIGTAGNDSLAGNADGPGNPMDHFSGLEGNDTLAAGGIQQTLEGQAGDDVLIGTKGTYGFGGEGRDLIQNVEHGYGDAGNDTLIGGLNSSGAYGSDLHGGPGDDSIVGTSGYDFLSGGSGSDVINAGGGDDVFVMFDMYIPFGPGRGDGLPGFSTVDGGAGNDTLRLSEFWGNNHPTSGNMTVDLVTGVATTSAFTLREDFGSSYTDVFIPAGRVSFTNFERVSTGSGNDSLNGSSGNDSLSGGLGSDTINGGAGNDSIDGDDWNRAYYPEAQDGSNLLRGEGGDDSISGGAGGDMLLGGDGDDKLNGRGGPDTMTGGAGADTFSLTDSLNEHAGFANAVTDWSPGDTLDFNDNGGGSGGYAERTAASYQAAYDDAQNLVRNAPVTYVATQVGADVIVFANNNHIDSATLVRGPTPVTDVYIYSESPTKPLDTSVILQGRSLNDISAADIRNAVAVDVGVVPTSPPADPAQPTGTGATPFASIGSAAALNISPTDKVSFPGGATQASVLYGANTVTVTMDATSVTFGPNISAVSKSGGLSMADGSKFFIGDAGQESFTGATTGDAAFGGLGDDTLDGGAGGDLLQGNQGSDRLLGGEGNDTVYGGQDADFLSMGSGANFGQGNRGEDFIAGGQDNDTLLGGQDNDVVQGDAGNDFLNGNRGDDSVVGGVGDDILYGEGGADTLAGGAGADVFHAFAGQEIDRIVDFSQAEGDRIVLVPGMTHSESQVGGDVVVNLGGGDQFVLVGVTLASLTGDWIGV